MRKGVLGFILTTIIISGCSSSSDTARSENQGESFERMAALIQSGNYRFTVRSASPTGGRTIQITSVYEMKAADGTFEALLPYFGQVYSGGYGQGGSIEFSGNPENLRIDRNEKRHKITVEFSIDSSTEKYDIKLDVGASGYGNLIVSSAKRKSISYYGLAGGPGN